MRLRISICAAALLAVAAIVAPSGGAHTNYTKAYLATFHCSHGFASFNYTLPAGAAFEFEVDHSFARVSFTLQKRHDRTTFHKVWGWEQPENWIVGKYHILTPVAEHKHDYAATVTTLNGSALGSCTVHVFIIH